MRDHADVSSPQAATRPASPGTCVIVAADDGAPDASMLEEQIRACGGDALRVPDVEAAILLLRTDRRENVDVVALALDAAAKEGPELVRRLKEAAGAEDIPVVVTMRRGDAASGAACVEAGALVHLSQPEDADAARATFAAALREAARARALRAELARHQASFQMIEAARFQVRTHEDAAALAAFMAHWFPTPDRVVVGLAQLLYNAIEHGSLEIGHELKGVLLEQGEWRSEVERRHAIEPYASRSVEVVFNRREDGCCVVITDQGPGFDWKRYLAIDPARAGDRHGRGIVHARAISFDKLSYNAEGNRAVGFVRKGEKLDW